MSVQGYVWALESAKHPLVRREKIWQQPERGYALLEVLGCGVCHTDLGFADGEVSPKAPFPLVLGHEIVGRVVLLGPDAPERLLGKRVLVPAVSPCGRCGKCLRGRPTACPRGRMPGNDGDGGFASHVVVPAGDLVPLDPPGGAAEGPIGTVGLEPWELAPLADAATTAWQAIVRAGLKKDEVAVFVGAGGVGGFGAQLATVRGAKVIALDVSAQRLDALKSFVDATVDVRDRDPRAVRETVRSLVTKLAGSEATVRVFETSGTAAGQQLAFELLERGGSLSVVGYTREKITLRLSNVMALDAEIYGNWGCDPALYSEVLAYAMEGKIHVRPFVERRSLEDANRTLDEMRAHALTKRVVLVPPTGGGQ